MSILLNHLQDIDDLKEKIESQAEDILKVINLEYFLSLNEEQQINYLKEILFDFWESQESRIKRSIELGEKKAKKIINGSKS